MNLYEDIKENWQVKWKRFSVNLSRLWSASKIMTIGLIGFQVILGLLPIVQLIVLFGLIDTLVAARGIGVWTSDVQTFAWYQVAVVAIAIVIIAISMRLEGVMKQVGRVISQTVFFFSVFLASLPIAPIQLFLLITVGFFVWLMRNIWVSIGYLILSIIVIGLRYFDLLNETVTRSYTSGQALLIFLSVFLLYIYIARTLFSTEQ